MRICGGGCWQVKFATGPHSGGSMRPGEFSIGVSSARPNAIAAPRPFDDVGQNPWADTHGQVLSRLRPKRTKNNDGPIAENVCPFR